MFSGSEIAYFSLKPADLKTLEEKKTKKSKLVLRLLETPEKLLANILVANNFANITIIILSTYITTSVIDFSQAKLIGFIFQVVVVMSIILFIGEIIPKIFATENKLKVALFMAFPLTAISKFQTPFTFLLLKSTSIVKKRLERRQKNISINDLSNALEITSKSLTDDKNILEGIVKFGNIDVNEIMTSRIDIVAVEYNTQFNRLLSIVVESGYSRIPIYSLNLDNIKGILFAKDLLPFIHKSNDFQWQSLIRPAYFVPESKMIDDLLTEFQKNKIHIAVVIDEYGGTCGIVTMEDILEEIVGEISDESDVEEEVLYKKLDGNIFLFEAKILLNDFCKIIGINGNFFDDVKGEFETLAGLILELKGEIPKKNEKIEYKNFVFVVESVDNRKIIQVRVTIK